MHMSKIDERDRSANIEVSDEMRRAGAIVLQEFSGSYGEEQLAETVYIAMARLRGRPTCLAHPSRRALDQSPRTSRNE